MNETEFVKRTAQPVNGQVAVKGWVATTNTSALTMAKQMDALGVATLIYTDISTDGMLTGPNFSAGDSGSNYVFYIHACDNTGDTTIANCLLLCERHHRALHAGQLTITRDPIKKPTETGYFRVHPPDRPPTP